MNQLSEAQLKRRYFRQFLIGVVVLGFLLVPAIIHSGAALGTLRNLPALWLPRDMDTRKDFFKFIEQFSVTDLVLVTWPGARLNDPSIDAAMDWLEPLSKESSEQSVASRGEKNSKYYEEILSGLPDRYPFQWVRSGDQLVDRLRAVPLNLNQIQAVDRLQGSLIGQDLKQSCIVISLDLSVLYHHRTLLPRLRDGIAKAVGCAPSDVAMVGGPVDGAAIDGAATRSITRFSLPSSAIAALLCLLCLRSVALSATIIAIAMITQGMALAVFYYADYDLNAVLIILPAFVFVLTISAGVHLCNYFRESLRKMPEASLVLVVQSAMAHGYKPCTLSVFTTVVGLLSLLLVRIEPVRSFGLAAAGSLLFALAMMFLMMPGAMLLSRGKFWFSTIGSHDQNQSRDQGSSRSAEHAQTYRDKLLRFPLQYRRLVFFSFAILSLLTTVGLGKLKSSVRVTDMFAEQDDLNRSYRWFETHLGPTMTGELLANFPTNSDLTALERYKIVYQLHSELSKVDGIGGVISCATFMPSSLDGRSVATVAKRAVAKSMIEKSTSSLFQLGFLRRSEQEETWRLTFRLFHDDQTPASKRLDDIRAKTQKFIQGMGARSRPQLALTGHVVIVEKAQSVLLEDLVRSFAAAFLIIAIFMSFMVGNLWGGLFAMVPSMVPTLVLFGAMGWLGLSLDIGLVMTASVALGIAVDDTLHLLSHFRDARCRGLDLDASVITALSYCGLAMFQTTVICGCSLLVYSASDFMPTQRFAVCMGLLLAMAWLGVAVLLPAMMSSHLGRWLASNRKSLQRSDSLQSCH